MLGDVAKVPLPKIFGIAVMEFSFVLPQISTCKLAILLYQCYRLRGPCTSSKQDWSLRYSIHSFDYNSTANVLAIRLLTSALQEVAAARKLTEC